MYRPGDKGGDMGLFPRTRRNPSHAVRETGRVRPISAYAEEPASALSRAAQKKAYLRVRGGTGRSNPVSRAFRGLSPRTRRNLRRERCGRAVPAPISAYAEEPPTSSDEPVVSWAYLRVRRNPRDHGLRGRQRGPISEYAEEPTASRTTGSAARAYLRVRGGTEFDGARGELFLGLSPRTRRNLQHGQAQRVDDGPISAYAEEPLQDGAGPLGTRPISAYAEEPQAVTCG